MKIKMTVLILTLIAVLVASGGCSLLGLGSSGPLQITMTGKVGEKFVVALNSNPSTGYKWEVEYNPAAIELVDETYVADSEGTVGGSGKTRFTFQPRQAGVTNMVFRYMPPGGGEASQTVVYTATISG